MMVAAGDWTSVLNSLIIALPAIIAAIYAGRVHRQIKTPSGKKIGEVVEYTHDTSIANNMLLSKANGETRPADHDRLHEGTTDTPRIPADQPPETPESSSPQQPA